MLPLKSYQQQTLTVLQSYLTTARYQSVDRAFIDLVRENPALPAIVYQHLGDSLYDPLYDIPYICMRLPTGGGKTLLAAHSIAIAASAYLHQEQPLVLWLVPSDAIRRQTLATLRNSQHPNRQAIDASFSGRVLVLDIAEFEQLRPQDLQQRTCILVGTLQTLRVNSTEGRRVYAHNEHMEPHFANVRRDHPDLEYVDGTAKQKQIRYSLRNLLALQRPLVIVDEAHNASTKLSVEVMQRIRPMCVLEFTATPATNSNIIHTISAVELKQEEMIKLPIILTEHPTWQEAIHHSILTRNRLQMAAEKEAALCVYNK
jgi:type III restriction enzyme